MTPSKPNIRNPIHLLAFGLGSGLSPKAPGTMGTIAALPIYWWGLSYCTPAVFAAIVLLSFVLGVWVSERTSRDLGVHDHGGIVIDEWVGMWITLFLVPKTLTMVLLGFVLFRFFDIIKPWPIKWLDQHVKGGFGIMIDDVLAGLMSLACMHVILLFV